MTHELGPTARSLVAVAREGLHPDPGAAARVRARIAASVAGAGAGAAATTTASKATGGIPAIAGTSVTVKVAVTVAAVLALVGATMIATAIVRHHDPASSAPAIATPPSGDDEPRTESHVRDLAVRPDLGRPKADCPKTGRLGPDCPNIVRPSVGHAAKDGPASLAREVELIDRAMASLKLGHPSDALVTIKTFVAETAGSGQLAEDAAAIEIEARCQLHQPVAAELDTFDRRWPSSAQRARLTAACPR